MRVMPVLGSLVQLRPPVLVPRPNLARVLEQDLHGADAVCAATVDAAVVQRRQPVGVAVVG